MGEDLATGPQASEKDIIGSIEGPNDVFKAAAAMGELRGVREFGSPWPSVRGVIGRVVNDKVIAVRSTNPFGYNPIYGEPPVDWAKHRVDNVGEYRVQDSPTGPRILAVNLSGGINIAPHTEEVVRALEDAGYRLSEDPRFSSGGIRPDEIVLGSAHTTPDDGSYVDITPEPIVLSDEWSRAAEYWESQRQQAA